MDFLKKYFQKGDYINIVLLLTLFLITRLWGILDLPIFIDEGIYINLTKLMIQRPELLFNPLAIEGKPVFHFWEMIPFFHLMPDNLLLAARITSVFNGLVAAVGFFVLTAYLWGKKAGFIGTLLFITCPYFLFYDRVALVDSVVNAVYIWILLFSFLLIRTQRYQIALVFGLIGGVGLLIKSNVQVFLGLSALSPVLIWQEKHFKSKVIRFCIQFFIVLAISLAFYNFQRISEYFPYLSKKNANFVIPLSQFLQHPFELIPENVRRFSSFIIWETALLPLILALGGFYKLYFKDRKVFVFLALWFVLPSIVFICLLKVFLPRYIIFLTTEIILVATYYITHQKRVNIMKALIVIVLFVNTFLNIQTLSHAANLYFPFERNHFALGLGAGWGVQEIVDIARIEAQKKPVIIVTQGTYGILGDVFSSTLSLHETNIRIDPYWPLTQKELVIYSNEIKTKTVYVVFTDKVSGQWPLELIRTYPKPGNQAPPLHLYRFTGVMKNL